MYEEGTLHFHFALGLQIMQQFLQADSSGRRRPLPSSSSAQTSSLLPSQAGPPPGGDLPQTGPFFLCNILMQKCQASSNVERILEHLPPRTFPIFASSSLANLSKASSPAVWTKKGLLCSGSHSGLQERALWKRGKAVGGSGEHAGERPCGMEVKNQLG